MTNSSCAWNWVQILEEAGFLVAEATKADQATVVLEPHPDIRLIVTDIDMPGPMNGLKLAAAVRDRWPPVHIIVISGHVRAGESDLPHGSRFFSKPYRQAEMVDAVRVMMMTDSGRHFGTLSDRG